MVAKRAIVLFVSAVAFLPGSSSYAQESQRWQVFAGGGVYAPVNNSVHSVYSSGRAGSLHLGVPFGRSGRLRLGMNHFGNSGNPFPGSRDFISPKGVNLNVNGIAMALETGRSQMNNPKIFLGAGIVYLFGNETIVGNAKENGNGIGGFLVITPEITISKKVTFGISASYMFAELIFQNLSGNREFNFSGPQLKVELGYSFEKLLSTR